MKSKKEILRILKFALYSGMAGMIQMAIFTTLNEGLHWAYWPAYLVALVCSVLYNFTANRRFTFRSANNVPRAMIKVFLFYCVFIPFSTMLGEEIAKAGVNEYVILIATMLVNFLLEFLFCKHVVYRDSMDTNDIAQNEKEKEKNA